MVTGDGAYIKRINRSLIIEKIIEHEMISRADLSKITGLNKATISVQVADLLEEELITETKQEHNAIGRRPIMLSINEEAGHSLGIDLDYKQIIFTVTNLKGIPIKTETITFRTVDYNEIVSILAESISKYKQKYDNGRYGIINIVIAVHGTVHNDGTIRFIPSYQWASKNLKDDLIGFIGSDIPVYIENNANLSALAEKIYVHHNSNHLQSITLTSGIGTGIVINGEMQKGFHGYAGEMGHMIIYPNGEKCSCGNRGCWELYASEPRLLKRIAKKLNDTTFTMEDLKNRIQEKDEVVEAEMDQFLTDISIGLNNIINIYNPEIIVLNSEVLKSYPKALDIIISRLTSNMSQYREVILSELGNRACVLGACSFGIRQFLDVASLAFSLDE